LEFSEFAPREMIEQGRPWWFWEHSQVEQKDREGSKERMGARFKFQPGKVVFFQEYIDTAADVLAQRKPVAPLK
jgi:uncharacterized protein